MEKRKDVALLLLRVGLGIVFLLFGYQKLSVPSQTTAEIQLLLEIGIGPASALNYYVGLIEILVSLSLFSGFLLKWFAPIASFLITGFFGSLVWKYGLNQDPTLNRDLGLIGGALALWLLGGGYWSLDSWLERKKEMKEKQRLAQ